MSIKSFFKTGVLWLACLSLGLQINTYASSEFSWLNALLDTYNVPSIRNNSQDTFKNLMQEDYAKTEEESYPMQNMYLIMLQNIMDGPRQEAFKNLSYRTPYTKADLEKIFLDGNLSPISSKGFKNTRNAYESLRLHADNQDVVFQEWAKISYGGSLESGRKELDLLTVQTLYKDLEEAYQSELRYAMENKALSYQAMARELFMNGNRLDSAGVDILSDLNDLHYLFFGEDLLQILEEEAEDSAINLASEEDTPSSVDSLEQEENAFPLCADDETLREALQEYEANASTIQEKNPRPKDSESDRNNSSKTQASEGPSPSDEALAQAEQTQGRSAKKNLLQTALPKYEKFQDKKLCYKDRFCILINFKYAAWGLSDVETEGVAGAHPPTQKCYACHLAYIREHLDKTLSKSLLPGKLTTNFFEDATCKEAAGKVSFDFKINAIAIPIDLKPGKDPYEKMIDTLEDVQVNILGGQGFWRGRRPNIQDALVNRYEEDAAIKDKFYQVQQESLEFKANANQILNEVSADLELKSREIISENLRKDFRLLQENITLLQENLETGASTLNSFLNEKQACN